MSDQKNNGGEVQPRAKVVYDVKTKGFCLATSVPQEIMDAVDVSHKVDVEALGRGLSKGTLPCHLKAVSAAFGTYKKLVSGMPALATWKPFIDRDASGDWLIDVDKTDEVLEALEGYRQSCCDKIQAVADGYKESGGWDGYNRDVNKARGTYGDVAKPKKLAEVLDAVRLVTIAKEGIQLTAIDRASLESTDYRRLMDHVGNLDNNGAEFLNVDLESAAKFIAQLLAELAEKDKIIKNQAKQLQAPVAPVAPVTAESVLG